MAQMSWVALGGGHWKHCSQCTESTGQWHSACCRPWPGSCSGLGLLRAGHGEDPPAGTGTFAALVPDSSQGPGPERGSVCSTARILNLQTYTEVHRELVRKGFWGGRKGSRTGSCASIPYTKGPPAQVRSAEPTSVVTQRENALCAAHPVHPASTHAGKQECAPTAEPGEGRAGAGNASEWGTTSHSPTRGWTHTQTHTRAAAHRASHRHIHAHAPSDARMHLSCTPQTCGQRFTCACTASL